MTAEPGLGLVAQRGLAPSWRSHTWGQAVESESEEVIIKALVSLLHTFTSFKKSLACTLLWRGRGGKGDQRKQVPTLPLREAGTHAASATVSFIYGAARQQAKCASAAGPLLAL